MTDLLERRTHAASQLGDDRVDRTTAALTSADSARMRQLIEEETVYARIRRDELDDETREPWQVLIEIDEEILAVLADQQ